MLETKGGTNRLRKKLKSDREGPDFQSGGPTILLHFRPAPPIFRAMRECFRSLITPPNRQIPRSDYMAGGTFTIFTFITWIAPVSE